ncbi:MAG TPA: LacI family DNA-binding transcriptional regulator [Chloroflexota bacterium]|nr:LacI family DNA-binding transcriptional regulator [Chloroflexota bacterium]
MPAARRNPDQSDSRVTINDVAASAGVSVATVSRVLNSHPDVSPDTRDAVLKFAREMGYVGRRSSTPAGSPRTRRPTRLFGITVPDLRSEYAAEILTGANEALADRDARLVICAVGSTNGSVADSLMTDATDGALLVLPEGDLAGLAPLHAAGFPVVAVEPAAPIPQSIPAVSATSWAGVRTATEYLIELGHTHIGIISGPEEWPVSQDRVAGYHAALLAAGLPLVPHLRRSSALSVGDGNRAAEELLSRPHMPTAIIALGTSIAIGVLQAAQRRSLEVPRDLSVVTFDDLGTASITTPPLTAIRQPLQGEGRVAADMLYRLVEGQPLDARRIELSTELIVRESTAPPHGASFLT